MILRLRHARRHNQSGHTLVEAMVAGAVSLIVVIVAVSFLMLSGRWDRLDRNEAGALGPLRDAADYISRDTRIADHVECCPDGQLILHQKRETHLYKVTYSLSGDRLIRSQMVDYDPLQVSEQAVVYGLTGLSLSVSGSTIRIDLTSESGLAQPVTLSVNMGLIPRLGVVP